MRTLEDRARRITEAIEASEPARTARDRAILAIRAGGRPVDVERDAMVACFTAAEAVIAEHPELAADVEGGTVGLAVYILRQCAAVELGPTSWAPVLDLRDRRRDN